MPVDIWDEEDFTIRAALKSGSGLTKTAKFLFKQTGGAPKITDASADLSLIKGLKKDKVKKEKPVAVQIPVPRVPDGEDNYTFQYEIEVGEGKKKQKFPATEIYTVWPKTIKIVGKKDPSCKLDIPNFPYVISYTGKGVNSQCMADATLTVDECPIEEFGAYEIKTHSPYIIQWTKKAGRIQEATCALKEWTAKIHGIAEGKDEASPLMYCVNDKASPGGSLLKIVVGPEVPDDAVKDQEIKVRVTFPNTNCKRLTPKPGVWMGEDNGSAVASTPATAKPGVDELKYETAVKIPEDGEPAVFYVHLGVAGGDKCKIEVGVTDTYSDDKRFVQTMRKIGLELLVADASLRQKCPDLLADDAASMGVKLKAELKKMFEGTFIDLVDSDDGSAVLLADDLEKTYKGNGAGHDLVDIDKPENLFVSKDQFITRKWNSGTRKYDKVKYTQGDKVFLCSDLQRRKIRDTKLPGVLKANNVMTWVFCDFIPDRAKENVVGAAPTFTSDLSTVLNSIVALVTKADEEVELPFFVFDYDPMEANDSIAIKKVRWRAVDYRKKGSTPWLAVGVGTPGEAYKDFSAWTEFTTLAERDKWCELVDSGTLKVKLPADTPTSPGKLFSVKRMEAKTPPPGDEEIEYELKLQVEYHCYGVSFGVLGGAVQGAGQLRTSGGSAPPEGMANVIAHEIAHNCGQTYTGKVGTITGGWSGTEISGIAFGTKVPAGTYYVGQGHQGSHCAKGVADILQAEGATDDIKNAVLTGSFSPALQAHRTAYFNKIKDEEHCIMFGSADASGTKPRKFCDKCKEYLRAVDLSDITKSW